MQQSLASRQAKGEPPETTPKNKTAPELVEKVQNVLDEIHDPCSVATSVPMGLVEMGLVESVTTPAPGHVHVRLRLTSPFCEMIAYMKGEALRKIGDLDGVTNVTVDHDLGLDWDHDMIAPQAQARRQLRLLTIQNRATEEGALKRR
jgi:metal-sulfur cluster biosynthetic enzyme